MADPFVRAHTARPFIYNLAGRTPVSIRDQLLRAHLLTQRLLGSGVLVPGSRLLVVGAGAAGATVAILAARRNVNVILVDIGVAPFALQTRCTTRWIDPVQYDWPSQHASRGRWPISGWPADVPMKFRANYADQLADEWNDTLTDEAWLHPNLDIRFETRLRRYPNGGTATSRTLTADLWHPVHLDYSENVNVVVLARGIARERISVPRDADDKKSGAFVSLRFWQSDLFQKPTLGLASSTQHVLISGGGDGALQDYIRLTTGSMSALLLLEDIVASMPNGTKLLELLRWRFAEAEEHAHRLQLWSAGAAHDHTALQCLHDLHLRLIEVLRRRFPADWASVKATVNLLVQPRNPTRVRLIHPCTHFSNCYGLNRFVALLIRQCIFEDLGVDTVSGQTKVRSVRPDLGSGHPANCPDGCWGQPHFVELLKGAGCDASGNARPSGQDYHGVVIRHGTDQHTSARVRRHSLPRHLD